MGLAMHIPGLWRLAVNQIGLGAGGKLCQHRHGHLPLLGNDLAHWKTFAGVIDRWFQHLRKSQPAMPPLHFRKGIDRTRDRHRAPAIARNTLHALTSQSLQREVLGAAATAIDPVDLAVSGPAIQ